MGFNSGFKGLIFARPDEPFMSCRHLLQNSVCMLAIWHSIHRMKN